jgi:MFS transporter, OFA family, oxalate/formate antiporter
MNSASVGQSVTQTSDFLTASEQSRSREQSGIYYGWMMLLIAMAIAIASSPGQTFGVSIFIDSMRADLGLSHSQMGLAYTLGTLLGAGPIFWIGHQMDRHGLRRAGLVLTVVFGLVCIFMATVQSWLQVAVAFTLLRMLGPGAFSLLSANILPFWFSKKLGTVEGLRQTALALSMAFIPLFHFWLVQQFGWRMGYAVLGMLILGVLGPLMWKFFRNGPQDLRVRSQLDATTKCGAMGSSRNCSDDASLSRCGGQPGGSGEQHSRQSSEEPFEEFAGTLQSEPTRRQVDWGPESLTVGQTLRTRAFWIVTAGTSTFSMIMTGIFFSLTPLFSDRGFDAAAAATMLSVFAFSLAIHQVLGGWVADRVAANWQLAVGVLVFCLGLWQLSISHQISGILLTGALLGASQGIYMAASQPLWARFFGLANLGKLRGILMAINVAASSLGPLMVGFCRDQLGDFTPVLMLFAVLPLPLVAASLFVCKPTAGQSATV